MTMTKKPGNLLLLFWSGITVALDLLLAMFSLPIVASITALNDGAPDYERNAFTAPLHEVVITQVAVSLLFLALGIVWAALVLLMSERLLIFLKFPTPPNNKFTLFSLNLFKIAFSIAIFTILIGNISMIHDQIQGRTR